MRRTILLAASLVVLPGSLPSIVQAQTRGGMPVVAHAPVVAPRVAVRAVAPATATARVTGSTAGSRVSGRIVVRTRVVRTSTRPTGGVIRTTRPRMTPTVTPNIVEANQDEFSDDFFPVPGLGFDFPHLAAIQGAHGGFHHHRGFGMSFPLFGGGIFIPTAPIIEEEAPAAQPTEEVADSEPERPARRHRIEEPAQAYTYTPQPAPVSQQADEYVFVQRNGTLIFAVAYAWESGTLRYVTREGVRRNVSEDALDLLATQQFNEQRGLRFHLPA